MPLVLTLLFISVVLAMTAKQVDLEVFTTLFVLTSIASVAFLFLYFRLFM